MDEASYLRQLSRYPKVRNADFYLPPEKKPKSLLLASAATASAASATKRVPISTEERAAQEAQRAAQASKAGAGGGDAAERPGSPSSADNADFLKVFDAWVDSQWPDRATATKVKVAFRREHKRLVASLNLEEIEEVAEALLAR